MKIIDSARLIKDCTNLKAIVKFLTVKRLIRKIKPVEKKSHLRSYGIHSIGET
jgi:hypothetical protein